MWHRVDFIAKTQRLPIEELVEFAKQNADKFRILLDDGTPRCSTLNCDALVDAFVVKDQYEVGTKVRSYDFQTNRDCYIEGEVIGLDVGDRRYRILVKRQVFNGVELTRSESTVVGQIVRPPFNGLEGLFGKTNHVEAL